LSVTPTNTRPDRTRLRPELREMLEALDDFPPVDFATLDPALEREASELRITGVAGETVPVSRVDNLMAGALPVRIYRPEGATHTILFIHGGGWVVGSLDTHDNSCRILANESGCNVVSIGYRKAPEAAFPAAVGDCADQLDWLLREAGTLGLDVSRLVICGESAGGNLAAVLAIHARDRGIKLAGQALIYPVVETTMARESYRSFANGFYLAAGAMEWFIRHYVPKGEGDNPKITPLKANLAGVAPAFVATADHDPLRDEGRAYAAALIEAGVDTSFIEMPGTVHGIWVMNGISNAGRELIAHTARWINARQAASD
jgi:acetyl esterase